MDATKPPGAFDPDLYWIPDPASPGLTPDPSAQAGVADPGSPILAAIHEQLGLGLFISKKFGTPQIAVGRLDKLPRPD